MITSQIDLGQIILGFIMTTMGWLIKRELSGIHDRLDKHDEVIMDLVREVAILIGRAHGDGSHRRRSYDSDRSDT